jgi:hypothetical protein
MDRLKDEGRENDDRYLDGRTGKARTIGYEFLGPPFSESKQQYDGSRNEAVRVRAQAMTRANRAHVYKGFPVAKGFP